MLLYIGVLLLDRVQQEYDSNTISNRSLNRVSVGEGRVLLDQVFTRKTSPARACAGH
jgi:hypothetical protein